EARDGWAGWGEGAAGRCRAERRGLTMTSNRGHMTRYEGHAGLQSIRQRDADPGVARVESAHGQLRPRAGPSPRAPSFRGATGARGPRAGWTSPPGPWAGPACFGWTLGTSPRRSCSEVHMERSHLDDQTLLRPCRSGNWPWG